MGQLDSSQFSRTVFDGKWLLPFYRSTLSFCSFLTTSAGCSNTFVVSVSQKKKGRNLPNGEQHKKKKKIEIEGTPSHYGYFHPEKWNIKHVHYTLNLQLFLIAHGHFPIFPALLLAQRSGPWEKSLFYYLNPCTGAEPGESSHVCWPTL